MSVRIEPDSEWRAIIAAIRAIHPKTPVLIFGGHHHVSLTSSSSLLRDVLTILPSIDPRLCARRQVQYESRCRSLHGDCRIRQSVIVFCLPRLVTLIRSYSIGLSGLDDPSKRPRFARRYIDQNRNSVRRLFFVRFDLFLTAYNFDSTLITPVPKISIRSKGKRLLLNSSKRRSDST